MTPAAITALPLLQQLQQLRAVEWYEPEPKQDMHHPSADAAATLAQLAHLTQLTQLTLGRLQASTPSLVATASSMTNLQSFKMGPAQHRYLSDGVAITLPEVRWEVLSSTLLSQLLTSCPALKALSMEEVVLDQAGLDLLLAHPHVVHVAFQAIAATESRVDSPCSWRSLTLPNEIDIRTVAYVPLHSLDRPLRWDELLLPPDVPPDQLPQLLLKATTRIAKDRHTTFPMFYIEGSSWLTLVDYVTSLPFAGPVNWRGPAQAAFSPAAQSALFSALEPLAGIGEVFGGLHFSFDSDPTPAATPPRLHLGGPDLQVLDITWGDQVSTLLFSSIALAPGFFLALETWFPRLEKLGLYRIDEDEQVLAAHIMLFCQRMTRPMRLSLDPHVRK
jgi:hypothetical protein